jgi:hypothetical protein
MTRIFSSIAVFALVCLLATFALGWSLRSGNLHDVHDVATQQRGTIHRLAGIATGVCVILVDSIVVTYFIGTSRWCKEVADTYRLDAQLVVRSNRLKRRTFPIAVVSMLIAVAIVALGGAADPGAIMPKPETALHAPLLAGVSWRDIHLLAAAVGILAIAYGFYLSWNNIQANHVLIDDVLAEVKRIRTERGLDN